MNRIEQWHHLNNQRREIYRKILELAGTDSVREEHLAKLSEIDRQTVEKLIADDIETVATRRTLENRMSEREFNEAYSCYDF